MNNRTLFALARSLQDHCSFVFRRPSRISAVVFVAILAIGVSGRCPATEWSNDVAGFLQAHCYDCHAEGADEGGLSLDDLERELSSEAAFARWERIFDRVDRGDMPPDEFERPDARSRGAFLNTMRHALSDQHARTKGTVLRRLNRQEFENTLNDLFGTNLDLKSTLPEDGRAHEFDNVGKSLGISMVHMMQYMESIDSVVEAAVAKRTEPLMPTTIRANYADSREGKQFIGKVWKKLDDGSVVFFQDFGYPTGMLRGTSVDQAGRYRIRVSGYAHQSTQPITFRVGGTSFQRGSEKRTYGYFELPPGKPATVELEAWIDPRYMVVITPWGLSPKDYNIRKQGPDGYEGPGLAIKQIELHGPLVDEFPSRGHRLLFDGLKRVEIEPANPNVKQRKSYVPQFRIESEDPTGDARRVLSRVATKALRRPVTGEDLARYVKLFADQTSAGASFEEALRTATAAIFCSPDFLYFREVNGRLDDFAVATRLAYFLTRTTPDAELLAAAEQQKLTGGVDELTKQTRRLIRDPRFKRFVTDFTDAWLNLRDINFTNPDQQLFPEYDRFLEYSMLQETRSFFAELVLQNLSASQFIDADFAMLNNRLAEHYDIPGVKGPAIRAVAIPENSPRGDLLGQASVLKVSANGTNTSPVVRGVYVTERLIGQTPAPPPPGIPGVEPDIRGSSTLRELLNKHRDLDSCRQCHQMIDPPGFALECFNPVGGFRERYRSLGEGERVNLSVGGRKVRYRIGPPVDASGELADGQVFEDYLGFRQLLSADEDLIARTLVTKLLTFATGREMGFSDRAEIERMVDRSRREGHRVGDLIELVITSEIFRTR